MPFFNKDARVYIYRQNDYIKTEDTESTVSGEVAPIVEKEPEFIYELSATTSFSKTESAQATNFPVADGSSRSDHYKVKGAVINFSGVITPTFLSVASLFSEDKLSPKEYVEKVKDLLQGKDSNGNVVNPLVTIQLPDGNTEENCVITNFKIQRTVEISDGYKIDVTAKKLLLATDEITTVPSGTTTTPTETKGGDSPTQKDLGDPAATKLEELITNIGGWSDEILGMVA